LPAYAQRLHNEGYAVQSGQLQLRLLGLFNRWLVSKDLGADEVDSSTVERFLRSRRKAAKLRRGDIAALTRMLHMLRPRSLSEKCDGKGLNGVWLG
jgi:hypothetical protein